MLALRISVLVALTAVMGCASGGSGTPRDAGGGGTADAGELDAAGSDMDADVGDAGSGDMDAAATDAGGGGDVDAEAVDAGGGGGTDAGGGGTDAGGGGTDAGGGGTDAGGGGTDAGRSDAGPSCGGVDCSAMDGPCVLGVCNPATGACTTMNRADGTTCSDGSMCTTGDSCAAGTCVGGAAPVCNDGNVCTTDSCAPATGCVYTNNTASCSDGNACTTADRCSAGTCVGGAAPVCNDGNVCTNDSCAPATGCVYTNNTAACSDGSACTTGDTCSAGTCVGGAALVCNDGNVCTTDTCAAATGCVYTNNTLACSDGSACTTTDRCSAGTCSGTPVVCNDSNVCTTDTCVPATGCAYTPVAEGTTCSDGRSCSTGDVCTGGVCAGRAGALAFRGFANWSQAATTQSDLQQDALMDAACVAAFPGSHAATTVDLVSARIAGLPATNTSSNYVTGKCPNCAGSAHAACVDGHARNCVNPGAAWPVSATPWTSEPNCHTSTRSAVCVVPRLQYQGFATWTQAATTQSDAVQDAAMDTACNAAFAGSRAATIAEMVSGTISALPATNTSGNYVLGKCPSCAGAAHAACVDGHARNCVRPAEAWPVVATPWSSETNCHSSPRSAICVRAMSCPFRGFATWSQAATTQSDAVQDAAMNTACNTAFAGSVAATVEELGSGVISGLPATNTSGNYALGRCPSCAGAAHAACVDGHARNCVNPGSAFPASFSPWPLETNCHSSTRSAVCF